MRFRDESTQILTLIAVQYLWDSGNIAFVLPILCGKSYFCPLFADPFAVHLFAEIRRSALLPQVYVAERFSDLDVLWMRGKA